MFKKTSFVPWRLHCVNVTSIPILLLYPNFLLTTNIRSEIPFILICYGVVGLKFLIIIHPTNMNIYFLLFMNIYFLLFILVILIWIQ